MWGKRKSLATKTDEKVGPNEKRGGGVQGQTLKETGGRKERNQKFHDGHEKKDGLPDAHWSKKACQGGKKCGNFARKFKNCPALKGGEKKNPKKKRRKSADLEGEEKWSEGRTRTKERRTSSHSAKKNPKQLPNGK